MPYCSPTWAGHPNIAGRFSVLTYTGRCGSQEPGAGSRLSSADPMESERESGRGAAKEMGTSLILSESDIWKEIDASESYLVSGMFEEAACLASTIVRQICTSAVSEAIDDIQLADMMVSAGMVFAQTLKELGRTSELLNELKLLFGSVAAIPVQVFLTGVCMQISEGLKFNLRENFEEYLSKWKYCDGEVYVSTEAQLQRSAKGGVGQSVMSAEKYLEVAEVYAITLLGIALNCPDHAISWTEKAELPEKQRQDMLRRLRSLRSATDSSSTPGPATIQTKERSGTGSSPSGGGGYLKTTKPPFLSNRNISKSDALKPTRSTIQRIFDQIDPFFWWFRTVGLKFANVQVVLPSGKIVLLLSLMFSIGFVLRNRSVAIKRIATQKALSIRRALVDVWQLAFSVQVNPLAAVQQLPSAPRGSR